MKVPTCEVGEKLLIRFPYDPETVAMIKGAPDGRRWDPKAKVWILPKTIDNVRHLLNHRIGSESLPEILLTMEKKLSVSLDPVDNLTFKTDPFQHQRGGLSLVMSNPKVFLMWEQGTGKSWIGVNIINIQKPNKTLIVCPNSVISSWIKEFKTHSELIPTVIKGKDRIQLLDRAKIALINYELLIFIEKDLLRQDFDFLILDESHYIKSCSAKRTKTVWKLTANIERRLLLTGTPITQGAEDIFSQYRALDGGETFGIYFHSFRNKYFKDVGYGFPDWKIKPGMYEVIKKKMFLKGHRITKEECFDLPPKNYQVVQVEMTGEQKKAYRDLEVQLFTEIQETEISINHLIVKLMKLNQVTSGFVHFDEKDLPLEHNKLKTLKELIEDKKKVVVWCLFRHDIEKIMTAFQDMNPVEISGKVSAEQRGENIERFQTDPDCRLFVGQVHSGGIGITLTAANFVVYYSQGYSLVDRLQSEDRTHRIGTTGTVTYVDLICSGTIDEDIIEIIEEKRKVAHYMTGDISEQLINKFKKRRVS